MNHNERGRATGLPGTQTTVTLYPQTLGVRMRNSIIRMIENRMLEGGWSSNARKLASALAVKYSLQVSTNNWNGIQIMGLTDEAAQHVKDVVHADWTAWLLENPECREGYYRSCHNQAMHSIDWLNPKFFITMHDKENIRKVREILAAHTSQELKDKSLFVANLLRGTEPITLTTF